MDIAEPPGDSCSTRRPYARAAEAVREGFLAAADAAGREGPRQGHSRTADGVLSAFEAAHGAQSPVVVGPLVRDDLKVSGRWRLEHAAPSR